MTQMLLDKFPETKIISSVLVDSNREAYMKALREGLSPREAIKQTAAYKSRVKFGFTKIEETSTENIVLHTTFPTLEECLANRTPFLVLSKP